MRIFLLLCLGLSLEACVSSGPYFKLGELEDLVRDRYTKAEVIEAYGPGKAVYSDTIYSKAKAKTPTTEKLLVQEMDGLVFSAVQGEVEDDYNDMEFAPGEQPRMVASNQATSSGGTDFVSHSSETTEFNDCEKKKVTKMKYLAERSDLNGYTERQFTTLMVDRNGTVCGYRLRSVFVK